MGRRKIEIQPITQERNRSVTFLKRKNGLFKKAYELGVLCSVDVAVIIFETRPGQDPKLHQYCSTNIRDVIQRHVHHRGEKDVKGPGDFGGTATADDGEDDEGVEIDDGDEDAPAGRTAKRKRSGGLRVSEVVNASDNEYFPPPPGTQHLYPPSGAYLPPGPPPPPPQPQAHMHTTGRMGSSDFAAGMRSLLPVSNDRVSSPPETHTRVSKRQRRDTLDGSADLDLAEGSGPPEHYLSSQQDRYYPHMRGAAFPPPPPPPQHEGIPGGYNPYHIPHSSGGGGGGGGHHAGFNVPPNPMYAPMYPSYAAQRSAPPSFIPLNTEFGPPRGGHANMFRHDMGPNHEGGGERRFSGGAPPHAQLPYDPALFHAAQNTARRSPMEMEMGPGPGPGRDGQEEKPHVGLDVDVDGREGGDDRRTSGGEGGGGGGGGGAPGNMEWPTYRHGGSPAPPPPPGVASSQSHSQSFRSDGRASIGPSSTSSRGDASTTLNASESWFDLFSSTAPTNAATTSNTGRISEHAHAGMISSSRPSTSGSGSKVKTSRSESRVSRDGFDAAAGAGAGGMSDEGVQGELEEEKPRRGKARKNDAKGSKISERHGKSKDEGVGGNSDAASSLAP